MMFDETKRDEVDKVEPIINLLKQVPWCELRTAHGNAGHVPDAVCGLLAADPAIVSESYWRLDNHVVIQSDLYEAAAYLPPVLFAALSRATSAGRIAILDLLYEIGCGWAPPESRLRFELTPNGEWKPYRDSNAPTLVEACRQGVLEHLDQVQAALSDPEARVRQTAADLIEDIEDEH